MDEYERYQFDVVTPQPFIKWLEARLRRGQHDSIHHFARRVILDKRLPRQASRSFFASHLKSKGYSADDLAAFESAWLEMRDESFANREKHLKESEES